MDRLLEPFKLEAAVEGGSMQRMGMRSADKNGAPIAEEAGSGRSGRSYERHDGWGGPDTKDEWLTPPSILRALGAFDLDPCAPEKRPWEMAATHYTWRENGLLKPWTGRVWLNPPYGLVIAKWLARMAEHRNGIVMIFARTESEYWHKFVWPEGDGFLFLRGRVKFCNVDGTVGANTGPAPSVLIAYGAENVETLKTCGLDGAFLPSGRRGCGAVGDGNATTRSRAASHTVEAWHPLPGAPLRFRLRFVATLRLRLGAGSGLPSAVLFAFCVSSRCPLDIVVCSEPTVLAGGAESP